jgi:hypothetical protein
MKTEHKLTIGIVLGSIILLVGVVWIYNSQTIKNEEKLSKPLLGEKMVDQGAKHVDENEPHEEYNSNPPTSGPHWAGVAGAGIKNEIVPDELILHSMEHGAAVIWYREGLDQGDIDKIKEAFNASLGKKIMLPRKDLDVPVALTSWGYLLKLENIDSEKIKEFIETNNDRAPEKETI